MACAIFARKYGFKDISIPLQRVAICICTEIPDHPRAADDSISACVDMPCSEMALTPPESSKSAKIEPRVVSLVSKSSKKEPIQPVKDEKNATKAHTVSIVVAELAIAPVKSSTPILCRFEAFFISPSSLKK